MSQKSAATEAGILLALVVTGVLAPINAILLGAGAISAAIIWGRGRGIIA